MTPLVYYFIHVTRTRLAIERLMLVTSNDPNKNTHTVLIRGTSFFSLLISNSELEGRILVVKYFPLFASIVFSPSSLNTGTAIPSKRSVLIWRHLTKIIFLE